MLRCLTLLSILISSVYAVALPAQARQDGREVSPALFKSLEELARIVDISYCVGMTGIQKPFSCLSRCNQFEGFELITTWNTGPFLSDSCGYIALSHEPFEKRVIVAFRGTYSIANTIADLSTVPAEYASYPDENDDNSQCIVDLSSNDKISFIPQLLKQSSKRSPPEKCTNCTVHSGFLSSWRNTRCTIIPHVEQALRDHPDYQLTLVGHSLGGAVAALAALEFQARGWTPQVTTFGEPRVGNRQLSEFIDRRFNLGATNANEAMYRRVTHVDDPVPLLPLEEWGYTMHAGEIYISKSATPPSRLDLMHCVGDQDPRCIRGGGVAVDEMEDGDDHAQYEFGIPARYNLWNLFFAHRDYFLRIGLCVPGGTPWDWWKAGNGSNETSDEL